MIISSLSKSKNMLKLGNPFNNHNYVITKYFYSAPGKSGDSGTSCNSSNSVNPDDSGNTVRILQLSDLHGDFNIHQLENLMHQIDELKPDLVFITGDLIDHVHFANFKLVTKFLDYICLYKTYYVTGNHEYMHPECEAIIAEVTKRGITYLDDTSETIIFHGKQIRIMGVNDPLHLYFGNIPAKYRTPVKEFRKKIADLAKKEKINPEALNILLSHRPEFFRDYVTAGFDIVMTGHAHGGQWKLPFIGPFVAPDQGIKPKYASGIYTSGAQSHTGACTMYISRGLGNSTMPIRFNNPPELIVVDLQV